MSATISTRLPSPPITQAQEVIKAAEALATRPTPQGATTSAQAPVPMATTAAATLTEVPTREVATAVLNLSMASAATAVGMVATLVVMEEILSPAMSQVGLAMEAMVLVTDQAMALAMAQLTGEKERPGQISVENLCIRIDCVKIPT